MHPLDLHVVLGLELLHTHGTEIAPGSDVVGEAPQRHWRHRDASCLSWAPSPDDVTSGYHPARHASPRRTLMLTNGQAEGRKIPARLKHPIIDADGHWAEFAPLMREEFRRIGGDTAVEALAMAGARIPNPPSMSVAARR